MIWKTTLSKLADRKIVNLRPQFNTFSFILILLFLGSTSSLLGQTTGCDIIATECPPSDLIETCGNLKVDNVLGEYVTWTAPNYSLECSDGSSYQYQISFDLPESKQGCWEFHKVQRVGTGVLNLWSSDGNSSGVAEITSPYFYMDEVVNASMDIFAETGQDFKVDVYLDNSAGTRSGILESFDVTGNGALTPYAYSINPAYFDGSGTFEANKIFRLHFEFSAINQTELDNKSYIEFISIDAGLFGSACAAEANFAVVSTHSPGGFFPVGTTTVTYTATCNGCVPAIEESCSFDVIVNPIPNAPTGATPQSFCAIDNPTVADLSATGESIEWYTTIDGNTVATGTLVDAITYYASQTVGNCESDTRLAVAVTVNDPAAPTGETPQSFCAIDNPTVADLSATGTGIVWYTTIDGNTVATGALVDGITYYASQTIGSCESDTRLAVAVTVNNPAAPTDATPQSFCAIDNPIVADLSATGESIEWYTTIDGNTVATGVLVDGNIYYASQTIGSCESDTRLEVTAIVNQSPIAKDDIASTDEDTPITLGNAEIVDLNDTDADGDDLTIVAVSNPQNGTIILNDDDTVTFTPDENFNGVASFDYTISDNVCGEDSATVEVFVGFDNDPPVAVDDTVSTDEDTPITLGNTEIIDPNDTDADGDDLTIVAVSNPVNGTIILNDDGTVTFTPNENFNGEASFDYTITDGNGGTDTATVTITVNPINDAPVANDDVATTDEDNAVTVSVLDNDSDVDGDDLSVDSTTDPENGSVTINNDGTITYTPNDNFNGEDSFTYTISDGNGGTGTATVSITVNPIKDAPVANDDSATTDEDNAVTVSVLDNDSDVDGDDLSVDSTTDPENGSVTINNDGTITYTPNENFNGEDSFTYTISDGNGGTDTATVTITVNPINDAPLANDDVASTDEDNAVTVSVLDNDSDVDGDDLSVDSTTDPENGSVTINNDGTITYTPNPDFNGTDTFDYTIKDEEGLTATATVSITVNPINDAPVAVDDEASTDEDNAVTVSVLDNDSDVDGDDLSVDSTTDPENGSVTINNDGTITYTPNPDFNGTDTFTYTVSDGNEGTATVTVTITVNPVNDVPVALHDLALTNEDNAVTVSVLDNDSDVDGDDLSVDSTTDPENGSVVINNDGTITYTPNPDFNGTDTFDYTIKDEEGLTATATVSITVNPINDAPVANDDVATTDEDNAVTVSVLDNDSDVDGDDLSVDSTTDPENGSVTINNDGTITYTPNDNFNGEDSFTYTISDGNGGADTATVSITVNPIKDAPVANDDSATTDEDNAVTVSVLDNDSDIDGDGLTVVSTTNPGNSSATINEDGTITYTPDLDFNGEDSFTYTVSDGNGGTDTATVTITVNPVDDRPDPPIIAEVVQPTCEIPTGTITVETIQGLTYSVGVDYQESGTFSDLEPGTYEVTAQIGSGLTSEVTSVTLEEPVAQEIQTTTKDLCIEDSVFELFDLLSGEYDETGTWEGDSAAATAALDGSSIDPALLEVGNYSYSYILTGNCPPTTTVQVSINDLCVVFACSLDDIKKSISKAVTPNGDGFNDFFTIGVDLDCGFTFDVKIFNRWGAEIYSMKNYRNNWDGYSDKSFSSSDQLPSGTYYYIIEINAASGLGPIQGYIYLGTK